MYVPYQCLLNIEYIVSLLNVYHYWIVTDILFNKRKDSGSVVSAGGHNEIVQHNDPRCFENSISIKAASNPAFIKEVVSGKILQSDFKAL